MRGGDQLRRAVVGIGNPLRTDDGVGPAVVARLLAGGRIGRWDPVVLENDLTALGRLLFDCDEVVVVDAVLGAGSPGTVHLAPLTEAIWAEGRPLSLHELELASEIALARVQGAGAVIWLFGIVPFSLSPGIGLSSGMEAALPEIETGLKEVLRYRSGGMELRRGSSRWSQR